MDWQEVIDNAVEMLRANDMKTSPQLTLSELILKLEHIEDKNKPVIFDKRYFPVDIDSWRGSYRELALEYADTRDTLTYTGEKLTVGELLKKLKATIGATLYGYKGGEFLMGKTTPVWVAQYGESGGFTHEGDIWTQAVVNISEQEQAVILETRNIEY